MGGGREVPERENHCNAILPCWFFVVFLSVLTVSVPTKVCKSLKSLQNGKACKPPWNSSAHVTLVS